MAGTHDQPTSSANGLSQPSWFRSPWLYIKWWVRGQSSPIAAGVIAGALTLALAGGPALLVKTLGPTGKVPGYVLAIAGGAGVALGGMCAWRLTRAFYEQTLRERQGEYQATLRAKETELGTQETRHQLLVRSLTAELELERKTLADLEPDRQALRRLGIYSDHVSNLTEGLVSGEISLEDLTSRDAGTLICKMTQEHLKTGVGDEFVVSIWGEPMPGRFMGQLHQRLPSAVSDRLRNFDIVCAPGHSGDEREEFAVHIEPSWLKHNQRQELKHSDQRLYIADQLDFVGMRGDDLDAFRAHGYQSVRATSFRRDGMIGYIVVLAKQPHAFSRVEDRYILWLRHVLELDEVIRNGRPFAPADDDQA